MRESENWQDDADLLIMLDARYSIMLDRVFT
jgi:hypothetical protein